MIPWCGVGFFLTLFLSDIEDTDRKREEPITEHKVESVVEPKNEKGEEKSGVDAT